MTTSTARPLHSGARAVLALGAALCGVALLLSIVGLLVDPLVLTGAPAWMKPAKFAVSIGLYFLALRWIVSLLRGHRRLLFAIALVATVGLVAELAGMILQVVRRTTSHFNESTVFDAALYNIMGAIVAFVLLATVGAGVLALLQRDLDPGIAAGLRWGIGICILGMLAAITMVVNEGHAVGGPEDGPGMLVTGWSLVHGDLRIGHFVGLHALQLLPLLAWALMRFTSLGAITRTRLLTVVGSGYATTVLLVVWQASRGQSILRPDALTLLVTAAVITTFAITVLVVLRFSAGRERSGRRLRSTMSA